MSRRSAASVRFAGGLLALALLALAGLGPGCAPKATHPSRVIFVGIDAADWTLINPLLQQGKLPNFAKLVARGATGRLATLEPLAKSPTIWTSIATGVYPNKHGIGDFVAPAATGDSIPYTDNVRRVKAIWNILGEKGMKVAVVGWLITWPAEPVNGYMVSDYIQYEDERGIKLEHQTYPESLFGEIDKFRLTEAEVSDQEIADIYPLDAPPDAIAGSEWVKGYVKMVYAVDETFRRIALELASRDVQFLAVYFEGIDSLCHCCWGFRCDSKHPFTHVIDNYYVQMDKVLGEFMNLVDDRTLLVVASDHGFRGPWHTDDGALLLGVYMHSHFGMVGLMGKGVKRGANIPDASVIDITPTILYALGFPVARNMDGGVMSDAFTTDFLKANPVEFIATYENGTRKPGAPMRSPVDEKVKQKLKALGYIQ